MITEEIEEKFKHRGHDYVIRVIEDAKVHNRWRKDRLDPDYEQLHEYWILADEGVNMEFGSEQDVQLQGQTNVDITDAQGLLNNDGMFSSNSISVAGFSSSEVSRLSTAAGEVSTNAAAATKAKVPPKGKPPPKGKVPPPPKTAGELPEPPPPPQTILQNANAVVKRLVKAVGEAKKLQLNLSNLAEGGPLLQVIRLAAEAIEKQCESLQKFIKENSSDEARFNKYKAASEKLLIYYEGRRQFVTALQSVQRRQQSAAASAAV